MEKTEENLVHRKIHITKARISSDNQQSSWNMVLTI